MSVDVGDQYQEPITPFLSVLTLTTFRVVYGGGNNVVRSESVGQVNLRISR